LHAKTENMPLRVNSFVVMRLSRIQVSVTHIISKEFSKIKFLNSVILLIRDRLLKRIDLRLCLELFLELFLCVFCIAPSK